MTQQENSPRVGSISNPARPGKFVLISAVGLLVVGASVAGVVSHHTPRRLLVVEPGVLYRSALLEPHNLEKVLDRYGIRTVVCLLPQDTLGLEARLDEEAEICKKSGVRYVQIPMTGDTPPTTAQVEQWLELLDSGNEHPILVHCKHGVVRTGMMCAVYEIEYKGADNREVLSRLPLFGHDLDLPERQSIRRFILEYAPRNQKIRKGSLTDGREKSG